MYTLQILIDSEFWNRSAVHFRLFGQCIFNSIEIPYLECVCVYIHILILDVELK